MKIYINLLSTAPDGPGVESVQCGSWRGALSVAREYRKMLVSGESIACTRRQLVLHECDPGGDYVSYPDDHNASEDCR